ncbi:LOW QUALITY PROTEIN: hypothetical protein OSB04_002516 [Centaurea solstitialis]|uniref:Uncharacterized protein n=1 Tax=Centaurea solstitialis TaxID=347529 RepID=A0AA38TT53_9ASTR|nr:LOW QUALITY PROTEIN: hypothetical protein OSB04_002516 [Centaurea solstitialis]
MITSLVGMFKQSRRKAVKSESSIKEGGKGQVVRYQRRKDGLVMASAESRYGKACGKVLDVRGGWGRWQFPEKRTRREKEAIWEWKQGGSIGVFEAESRGCASRQSPRPGPRLEVAGGRSRNSLLCFSHFSFAVRPGREKRKFPNEIPRLQQFSLSLKLTDDVVEISGLGSAVDEIGEVLYEILLGLLSVKISSQSTETRAVRDSEVDQQVTIGSSTYRRRSLCCSEYVASEWRKVCMYVDVLEPKIREVMRGLELERQGRRVIVFQLTTEETMKELDVLSGGRLPMMCTLAKARKHVLLEGSSYLAYVVDSRKKTVANVPVVSEFLDIFPDDLPDISHERQVEFRIKLVPGVVSLRLVPGSTSGDAGIVTDVYRLPRDNQDYGKIPAVEDRRSLRSTSGSHVVLEDRSSRRVRGEDVHKAVFYTRYVYCEFIVMSFGLTNAPTALVDPKCRPMLVRSVILCLDEMLIYWGSREMQVEYIRGVLETYARHVECGGKKTAAIEILRRKLCEALGLISPGEVEDMAA